MLIQKAVVEGYIPFTHVGNKHVEFTTDQPITAFIGSNGSGKSSLLRAISVFPAIRTDYSKNGFIELTIEHDGHIFELGSHFENATSPNSFKKDGVELNIGGTGDTQKDLIEEHFGLLPYINELMSGKVQICSMVKSSRKQLFSSCYPSDLSFVLEYHKRVCSNIRAIGNQIKLMQQREGSLVVSRIAPEEEERLTNYKQCCVDIITRIDKVNLLLENEIAQLRRHPMMQKQYHPEELIRVTHRLRVLREAYTSEFLDYAEGKEMGDDLSLPGLNNLRVKLATELAHREKNKEYIQSNLQDIRDELDKLSNLKYASAKDKRDSIVNEMNVITSELDLLDKDPSWKEVPVIPMEKLGDVIVREHDIIDLLEQIHPYSGHIVGQEELDKLRNEIFLAKNTISTLEREKEELLKQNEACKNRLAVLTKNSYPSDCTRVCPLRATVESSVRDVRLRMSDIDARVVRINEHIADSKKTIDSNNAVLEELGPIRPALKILYDLLQENYLMEIALQGDSFITCLNTTPMEIINRVRRGIESSKKFHRYKNQKQRYDELTRTLSMMKTIESAQMSAETIERIVLDREKKLEDGIVQIRNIEDECDQISTKLDKVSRISELMIDINRIVESVNTNMNIKIIRTRIEFDQQMIREHDAFRNEVSATLREIERTLDDQKRIKDVLETEIRPTLAKLKDEEDKWKAVESGLNPSKGLPCIYLVRFINRLLKRANKFIREVWCHDMELVYLSEEDDLDFTIQVMQNKSTITKDISLCSNGEAAIINLAMILAIGVERGYLNWCYLKLDEIDAALTETHRSKLVALIDRLVNEGVIKQLFLVNHFAIQTGMSRCSTICLCSEGIVLPNEYNNENVVIY